MSGIFSRKIYDDCYQSNRLNQGTGPGTYKVNVNQIQNEKCIVENGMSNLRSFWYSPNDIDNISSLADIESHLKNLDLPDSRCLEGRTMMEKNVYANYLSKNIKPLKTACSKSLELENTRLDKSVSEVKMLTQTRFDFPIRDPRSNVYYGFSMDSDQIGSNRYGVNSRQQAKQMSPIDYSNKINNSINKLL